MYGTALQLQEGGGDFFHEYRASQRGKSRDHYSYSDIDLPRGGQTRFHAIYQKADEGAGRPFGDSDGYGTCSKTTVVSPALQETRDRLEDQIRAISHQQDQIHSRTHQRTCRTGPVDIFPCSRCAAASSLRYARMRFA